MKGDLVRTPLALTTVRPPADFAAVDPVAKGDCEWRPSGARSGRVGRGPSAHAADQPKRVLEVGEDGRSAGGPGEEAEPGGPGGGGIVVLGLGNSLLSDDGAGIHALAMLEGSGRLPPGVRLIDGGTVGPDLLPPVAGCDALLVLDAVNVGGEPGAVVRLELGGGAGRAGPRTIHEVGLETLLQDLALIGEFPRRAVLFGVQPASLSPGTGLSPPVGRGLETLVDAALGELRQWAQPEGGGSGTGNAGGNARTEDER